MRIMERIRRKGHWFLWGILIVFTITLFFGLTGGFTSNPFTAGQNAQDFGKPAVAAGLVQDAALKDVALLVNGREVPNEVFTQLYEQMVQRMGGSAGDDPELRLTAYGYTKDMIVNQELMLAEAERLNIRLTDEDWKKLETEVSTAFMEQDDTKTSGNILGDTLGKLSDVKAQNAAFEKYLQANGLTENAWRKAAQRDLLVRKVDEQLREEANSAKKAAVEKAKGEIDTKLKAGEDFAALAKEYSDGQSAATGGDIDWVTRSLLDPAVTEKLFAVKTGEMSDWIEIPAGWQKFLVYERKEAAGPEFDKAKPDLTKQIRAEKGDEAYVPTEDDLKKAFEKVRARVIELHTTDTEAYSKKVGDLQESAEVQINNPYVLAYQALRDTKLQPLAQVDFAALQKIAELAPAGEGYDFSLIEKKLKAGRAKPKSATEDAAADAEAEAAGEDAAAAEATDGDAAAADAADNAADPAIPDTSGVEGMTDSAGAEATEEEDVEEISAPLYALAAGLLETARQGAGDSRGDDFPYFMESKVLVDWLADEENAAAQPIDRDAARQELDTLLAEVVKRNTYSATAHAWQGLNYARLEKPAEAEAALAKAETYAPQQDGEVWQAIREGYKVLDKTDKVTEVDKKLEEFRQAQFQQMLQQQLQNQEGGLGTIELPPPSGE
jgi:hypothetical protein